MNKAELVERLRKARDCWPHDPDYNDMDDVLNDAIAALQEPTDNSELVERARKAQKAIFLECHKAVAEDVCDIIGKLITALQQRQPVFPTEKMELSGEEAEKFLEQTFLQQSKPVVDGELVGRLKEAYQNAFEHYGDHYKNLVVELDMSDLHEAIQALQQSQPVQQEVEQTTIHSMSDEQAKEIARELLPADWQTLEGSSGFKADRNAGKRAGVVWALKYLVANYPDNMGAMFNTIIRQKKELDALKAQQPSIGDALREKLEGMRFDLSLLAASDACFNELEAKCEAFDEAISIADSMSGVTAIEGEDNE